MRLKGDKRKGLTRASLFTLSAPPLNHVVFGAARYLADTRNFAGTVNFIFQPAEEGIGGYGSSAERLIAIISCPQFTR
jgi:hypothetical protein